MYVGGFGPGRNFPIELVLDEVGGCRSDSIVS